MPLYEDNAYDGLLKLWRAQSPVMRGALLMSLSTLGFAVMHASIRHVSATLPPFEIAFFRNVFGVLFLTPLLVGGGFAQMRTKRLCLHATRGLVNVCAMLMFFTSVSITPLAKVTALSFTAPIFAAALSVLFLGERFRIRRWAAIVIGFLGTLIVLRPGIDVVETGPILAIAASALWAVAMIMIKILSRTESSVAIVAWMGIFLGAFSFIPALLVWKTPTLNDFAWLAFIGFIGSIAQVSISQALKETDPTAVLPFDFLKLIWTTMLGIWLFNEVPDIFTWVGAAVIFTSGFYIAWRERKGGSKRGGGDAT